MSVATSEELLSNLRLSKLVEPARIDTWIADNPECATDPPQTVAVRLVSTGLVTAFQAELLLKGTGGELFIAGKYKMLDLLGQGGMGAVYLCEHQVLKTLVAVKVLPASPSDNPEARERFHREARAFATLVHPNLVRGFDVDTDGTFHFIVMEYVDGVDLQALVARRGPLPVGRAVNYIRQAAVGLAHAHAQGWVHRDVKPANVAVDRAGVVKVLDMGLARLVRDEGDGVTKNFDDGSIRGTADYLAPEQAQATGVDGRADVYSLGATLYFLLTSRPPFGELNTAQKLLAHQIKSPPPLRADRPDVPEELAGVVEKMMAKLPENRFQTGHGLAAALARWDVGGPFPPTDEEISRRYLPGVRVTGLKPTTSSSDVPAPTTVKTHVLRRPRGGRRYWLVRAAAALTAAVIAGIAVYGYAVWSAYPPPRDGPDPARGERPASPFVGNYIPVTRTHGPNQVPFPGGYAEYLSGPVHPTLAAALADPRLRELDNCRILLLDEVYEEQAEVDADKLPPGISIESARTDPPTQWIPPENADPSRPLLRLAGGSRVAVRNLAVNGMGRVDTLVSWARPGPGCVIHDARLTKFNRTGLVLDGPAGSATEPVQLSRVRIDPEGAAPADGCATVRGAPGRPARHVRVVDCRFEGPAADGLLCSGGAEEVRIILSRFFRLQNSVRFAGPGKLSAALTGNTTAQVLAAVRVDGRSRPGDKDDALVLRSNLFFGTGAAVRFGDGTTATEEFFRGSDGNWSAGGGFQSATPGLVVSHAPGLIIGLDPTRDAEFLRYPAGSPLATAGHDHEAVGVPPP